MDFFLDCHFSIKRDRLFTFNQQNAITVQTIRNAIATPVDFRNKK